MLYWGVTITLIDQASYGHVTAFLTNFMTVSVLFVTARKPYILLHLPPIVVLAIGTILIQENPKLIAAHFINISVFIIFCMLGSRMTYNHYAKMFDQELELSRKNDQLRILNHHFEKLSIIDDLTKIPNRRGLYEYVEKNFTNGIHQVSVLVIDVDAFKLYNDHYGHLPGNEVLYKVASEIQKVSQQHGFFASRFGGEEFIVVASNATEQHVGMVAEQIRLSIEQLQVPHCKSPVSDFVTISVGYAIGAISNEKEFEKLVDQADEALYEGKKGGRNLVASYTS